MALEDYKDIVGGAAAFVTCCQMFSGVFLCKDIYKNGSTVKTPAMPFIGGLVLSILFYRHALILNDAPMGYTNVIGFVLNVCYLLFYWLWTPGHKKSQFYKELISGITLAAVLLGYARIEDPKNLEFRFGVIVTVLLMLLIASPLFSLGEIIRTKSTESLPFPMIFSGFIVTAHWLLYGIIIKNNFVVFQNTVGFLLSSIQLALFVIFPGKPEKLKAGDPKNAAQKKPKKAD